MPFTHSYSVSSASGSAGNTHKPNGYLPSTSSSSILDAPSLRHAGSIRSVAAAESSSSSSSPLAPDSARSRFFSSGRKSPDPFRRFRRLSSSNSLNLATAPPTLDASQSFDSQQSQHANRAEPLATQYPSDHRAVASSSPFQTPRSAPPPLPSQSIKPIVQRPKRTKSSSISVLSSGLGLRSRDNLNPSFPDARQRHRKSASLSGSEVDLSSSAVDPPHAATTSQGPFRPASPSPSFSEKICSTHHDAPPRSAALPPTSPHLQSKQHKQAWYQAQQKTIELENPHNRGAQHPDSAHAKLFPLNLTTVRPSTADQSDRGRSSPAHSRSPQPVVETFLSEEEMLAAGIHVIRRRDDSSTTASLRSQDSVGLSMPPMHDPASVPAPASAPAMPPRLYGADHPDFLELIDSPITSKQPSPLLHQLGDPPSSSASMQRALSYLHAKSSSGSLSISSSGSTDYLPSSATQIDDASTLHNGSTGSLSSAGKPSFSFAKFRRPSAKQITPASISRPSTANSSSNEDLSSNKAFLFPPRGQQSVQQQQLQMSSSGGAPGYLSPGPGSSASPFLNKHSASVGRASNSAGPGATAQNGLAQVFNGGGSSLATVGPASSARSDYRGSESNGRPPPKPLKPKPSLLAAFPRSSNSSTSESIAAPHTAPLDRNHGPEDGDAGLQGLLRPPDSAGTGANKVYNNISHSRSQEAVAEARLEAEALRASAGTPMPPPRRLNAERGGYSSSTAGRLSAYSSSSSIAMARTTSGGSGGAAGGVAGALGQVGQLGAAMGRRGWDFMKTLQSSSNAAAPGRGGPYAPRYRGGGAGYSAGTAPAAENEPTRQWLMLLEGPDYASRGSSNGIVFGAPLKDVVLRSRLSNIASDCAPSADHLGVPDLGKEFSASFLPSPRVTPRASVAGAAVGQPLSREDARHLFLPRVIVRCIESLEKWGPSEEGIYRISGRSSHTAKLRAHFSDPHNDLHLDEINPADLDINSVCSLLKSYLRELPETLIPPSQSKALDESVARLFADTDGSPAEAAGGSGKLTDARAAQISAEKITQEITPLVRQLPVYNWYLLRELAYHLGLLAQPEVVARTKMPISNLTLVLAPTVSISLPLLQVLVRHRDTVFTGPAPAEDVAAAVAIASSSSPAITKRGEESTSPVKPEKEKPPKPPKPENLGSASRLPVMVRKRASSMGLGALLSSPTSKATGVKAASPGSRSTHRRTSSTTPSLELPAGLGIDPGPSSPASIHLRWNNPPSPSVADEPFERPSTSLGHFAEPSSSSPLRPSASANHRNRFGSRDAALRFNALALDDHGGGKEETQTPIARYYARIREEAELAVEEGEERDGAKTPLAATLVPSGGARGEMHRYWAEKTAGSSASSLLSPDPGRSGRTSALDRPRPPTSSSASFFAGRSRRQDSVNGLGSFAKTVPSSSSSGSSIPQLVRPDLAGSQAGTGSTKPLNIVKRSRGTNSGHSASGSTGSVVSTSTSTSTSSISEADADKTPRLGSEKTTGAAATRVAQESETRLQRTRS